MSMFSDGESEERLEIIGVALYLYTDWELIHSLNFEFFKKLLWN